MDTAALEEIKRLEDKLLASQLPPDLLEKAKEMVIRLDRMAKQGGNYAGEYDSTSRYIDWITALPWSKRSTDTLDIANAQTILNKHHYGLKEAKDKILEYLAILKLQGARGQPLQGKGLGTSEETKFNRAPILALIGLVGTGKTTLAYSIADAMGRKFERIPFGGIGDALYLRGQSRAYADAEPGAIVKALRRAGTKNPVILLDEIDRVATEARSTIMGVLVELLDPGQNSRYTDHYVDYPFDLSEVLFVATANNTTNISTAVLDRLEPIQMPSYTDEEKTTIARDFVLPKVLSESGMSPNTVQVSPEIWPKLVRPLGFDSGIRTLERTINSMVRKAALQIVSGQAKQIVIGEQNLNDFLS